MSRLSVLVLTPSELARECGAGALACYYPQLQRMVISGDGSEPGQPPLQLVIAHEYGHHVAPIGATLPGALLIGVQSAGRPTSPFAPGFGRPISPRRQGRYYYTNPGEAFAEGFAFYHYRNVIPWEWDFPRPNAETYSAIFRDVKQPWGRPTASSWTGSLKSWERQESRQVATPLDGTLSAGLTGPKGADFDLYLTSGGRRVAAQQAQAQGRPPASRFAVRPGWGACLPVQRHRSLLHQRGPPLRRC